MSNNFAYTNSAVVCGKWLFARFERTTSLTGAQVLCAISTAVVRPHAH